MQDAPPVNVSVEAPAAEASAFTSEEAVPQLSMEEREDGTVVIDLTSLVPKPEAGECLDRDPNPLAAGIVVCGQTKSDQRIGPQYGPTDEEEFASAVPRARVKLTNDAEAEANLINKGVGGFNANGGEVRVKIDF